MTISAIIIDDEPHARAVIHSFLEDHTQIKVVGEGENGLEGLQLIQEHNPDLLFLDIQMPEMSGFEMLHHIEAATFPAIIFTTAYDKYALKAFDVNAVDYLLKPFNRTRFNQSVDKALSFLAKKQDEEIRKKFFKLLQDYNGMKYADQNVTYSSKILIREPRRLFFVKTEDIVWIEAARDYVNVHMRDKSYLVNDSLNHFEQKLNPLQFIRIHRSYIINIDQIKELEPYFNGEYTIALKDGTSLKLSRTYRESFLKLVQGIV